MYSSHSRMRRQCESRCVHNPVAGDEQHDGDDLLEELGSAGYDARLVAGKKKLEKKLEKVLEDPGELVVVAAGDGGVRRVALALAGREIPMAILPTGTANNIAKSLGVSGAVQRARRGLAAGQSPEAQDRNGFGRRRRHAVRRVDGRRPVRRARHPRGRRGARERRRPHGESDRPGPRAAPAHRLGAGSPSSAGWCSTGPTSRPST